VKLVLWVDPYPEVGEGDTNPANAGAPTKKKKKKGGGGTPKKEGYPCLIWGIARGGGLPLTSNT